MPSLQGLPQVDNWQQQLAAGGKQINPATGVPYEQGTPPPPNTLGFQPPADPNLGESQTPDWVSGVGNAIIGHANANAGGQFGGNTLANNYLGQASQLGAAQEAQDRAAGVQTAAGLNATGQQYGSALTNFGQSQNQFYGSLGQHLLGQQAPTVNYGQANVGLGGQTQALSDYNAAANGTGPSAAQAQLQAGLGQSIQAQMAGAASTRGGFGLANAQYNAAQNAGQLEGQAANNAAQLRAQEQQAGMAGLANTASAIQQQQANNAQYNANAVQQQHQLNAQNALAAYGQGTNTQANALGQAANSQFGFQNAAANQGFNYQQLGQSQQAGYNQMGQNAEQAQLSADTASQQSNNQVNTANAANAQKTAGGIFSAIGGLF